jgi:hypothetical protein
VQRRRHLQLAIDSLRTRWPECQIAVVGTPGSEPAITRAGIDPSDVFIYAKRPRFSPAAFVLSATARAACDWRFDRVAVLWNDPEGAGQGNVDRTAFLLAPRGFMAITPDGGIVERRLSPQMRREGRRAMLSVAVAVVLGALYLPALLLPGRSRAAATK